ncbi:cupin-like domain-containing protein [Streptomyces sp. LaBMicrA B280]|uniref:cupin-like domain-containing protein n=1 Tax=Streptomyces sp. LaBMicrA B280 TaxID=3391001 RepID=UPI003BA45015
MTTISSSADSRQRGTSDADPSEALRQAGIDVRPIPRAADESPAGLRRAVRQRDTPLIFRGLAENWPARQAWDPERLRETHGQREVTALMGLPTDGVLYPKDQKHYERTLGFGEFIDAMLDEDRDGPCYLAYQRAAELLDPSDCDFTSLLGSTGQQATDTRVWIGSSGTRSMLHSDLKDNLFCQIWGTKTVTLLPWRDSRAAYPFPDNLVNSQIDVARPDVARHPLLRDVTFYSTTVGPGDIVFIPRGCWHDIRSHTPSVSVNHWFGASQSFTEYLALLGRLGPSYWQRTAKDFIEHGLRGRREETRFFFSPPSTGKRLYDALRTGNFSEGNDPSN